ncbi:MAG: cytochrome c oxidase subunit II [Meiothermus sp.]|nr:cytochrome c oxidase subunit II [Meiothermus sp.]
MFQRSLGFIGLLLWALVWAAEPGQAGNHTLNIWDTQASSYNREVVGLMGIVFFFAAIVFVVVTGALIYVTVKFRRTGNETSLPPQTHGNDRLEIAWTIIPTVIVLIIFGFTARSMIALDKPPAGAMVIEARGWQFWWDFVYKAEGVRNSNEVIIPVGKPVIFEIRGGFGNERGQSDVIHAFRITSMHGAQDAIPGMVTKIYVTADKIGDYYGQCVELCGPSHSNMRFRVKVVSQEDYDRWINGAKAYTAASNPQFAQGEALFKASCAGCHAMKGVSEGLPNNPDLTFMGNRTTVGAGMWPNEPRWLEAWIKNSPGMKPGIKMPAFTQLSDAEVKAISDYLLSHKVDGLDLSALKKY